MKSIPVKMSELWGQEGGAPGAPGGTYPIRPSQVAGKAPRSAQEIR